MTRKSLLIVAASGLVIATASLLLFQPEPDPATVDASRPDTGRQHSDSGQAMLRQRDHQIAVGQDSDPLFLNLKAQMHQQMGHRLERPFWRVKMVRDLAALFQQQFPDDWENRLLSFLRFAFPDEADDLIEKYYALQQYEDWMKSLPHDMEFASRDERRQAMWDKRVALFGDEAYEIWEAAYKTDQFDAKMDQLAQSQDSFDVKQQQYVDSMIEVFGAQSLAADAPHKTQKLQNFLELENVQQDLFAMSAQQQAEALRGLRTKMGMDDAALERWDQLDQQRAERRRKGEGYMMQREQLVAQFSGSELQQQIEQLQVQTFGETDAEFIRKEERSGYYRFDESQKIGIN